MSEKNSTTPETPKPSKFVQKLNGMKPAALSDEKKAAVVGRIKMIGAFTAGVAATLVVAVGVASYDSIKKTMEGAEVSLRCSPHPSQPEIKAQTPYKGFGFTFWRGDMSAHEADQLARRPPPYSVRIRRSNRSLRLGLFRTQTHQISLMKKIPKPGFMIGFFAASRRHPEGEVVMTKEIEKKSKSKFLLKLLAIAAIAGAVWNIALRIISGNDNTWED